jgi:hypothetical protein
VTEAVAAAPVAAPTPDATPSPNLGRPTFNHPAIPPLRNAPKAAEARPDQVIATEPAKATEAPVEPPPPEAEAAPEDDGGDETIEYLPDDEFTVTVDGKEQSVTLAKLLASYQRNEAANARFTEAKTMIRNAQAYIQHAATPNGFVEVMRKLNVDPYELAETIVLERYQYENMSQQEREMHDYKREREQWDRQRAQEQQTQAQRQAEAQAAQVQAQFLDRATAAMDRLRVPANVGLRNELIGRAAAIMRADLKAGYTDVTPQMAMQDAWSEYQERLQEHARTLPLDRRLTEEERAKVAASNAQERVRVAQQAPKSPVQPTRADDGKFAPKPKPKMDMWSTAPRK